MVDPLCRSGPILSPILRNVPTMDIILIAGLWLPSTIWADVADELRRLGHQPIPLDQPGIDDGSRGAVLDDQVAAVLAAVDAADRPMVVGHSAAASLAWIAADQRPDGVGRVVVIGGFPSPDGSMYANFFAMEDGVMPFPGWEPFEGPDTSDLDDADRENFVSVAVDVPEGVAKGIVRLSDERRHDVPVLLVCPEFTPDEARAWLEAGDIPELAAAERLDLVNIDSGHWPMITHAAELAAILDEATRDGT
jgi:pimeloyl-ACP methyl ester carboxylesterase